MVHIYTPINAAAQGDGIRIEVEHPGVVLSPVARNLPRLRLLLARFVMKPGSRVLRIDQANQGAGFVPLRQALQGGGAFAVEVEDDVFALDVDRSSLVFPLYQLMRELRAAGHMPTLWHSGQEGHLHLFCRVGDKRKDWLDRADALGFPGDALRSGNNLIRPPLSPHRLGYIVGLADPETIEEALIALHPPRRRRRRLTAQTFEKLARGDIRQRYRSRSELVQGIVDGMWNRGWGEDACLAALLNPENIGGAKVREQKDPAAYVATCYRKAATWCSKTPALRPGSKDVHETLSRLREAIDRVFWSGKSGATRRSLLLAHLAIAEDAGSLTHTASDKQLAEKAGCSRRIVTKHHRALCRLGWLSLLHSGKKTREASTWRANDRSPLVSLGGHEVRGERTFASLSPGAADYFRWQGAGKSCLRVFDWLRRHDSGTAAEIATALGWKTARSAQGYLSRLSRDGIVSSVRGAWRLADDFEGALIRAAASRGTLGATVCQAADHEEERQARNERREKKARQEGNELGRYTVGRRNSFCWECGGEPCVCEKGEQLAA